MCLLSTFLVYTTIIGVNWVTSCFMSSNGLTFNVWRYFGGKRYFKRHIIVFSINLFVSHLHKVMYDRIPEKSKTCLKFLILSFLGLTNLVLILIEWFWQQTSWLNLDWQWFYFEILLDSCLTFNKILLFSLNKAEN